MTQTRVLVVEDEPGMLEVMRVNLEQAGFGVVQARDGMEAYEALERSGPGAVILDLSLPKLSGFRLLRLRRDKPEWMRLPVIVVTAFAFEEVEEIAHEGVDGFVSKPFDPASLVSTLQYVLARRTDLPWDDGPQAPGTAGWSSVASRLRALG